MIKKVLTISLVMFSLTIFMASKSCEAGAQSAAKISAHVDANQGEQGAECQEDADCGLIKADCCGCNQGGTQMAVSLTQLKAREAEIKSQCYNTACIQMISNHASCKKMARCQDGRCSLADK